MSSVRVVISTHSTETRGQEKHYNSYPNQYESHVLWRHEASHHTVNCWRNNHGTVVFRVLGSSHHAFLWVPPDFRSMPKQPVPGHWNLPEATSGKILILALKKITFLSYGKCSWFAGVICWIPTVMWNWKKPIKIKIVTRGEELGFVL